MSANTQYKPSDVVIVGGGIAGLSTAIYLAEEDNHKQITVLFKGSKKESNTNYAQGGIVGVFPSFGDSVDKHIEDTLIAGNYTNNKEVVSQVSLKSSTAIQDLIRWGVHFDKQSTGQFDRVLEGGHSFKRIFHSKDKTGQTIQQALISYASRLDNIQLIEHSFLYDFEVLADNQFLLQIINSQLDLLCKVSTYHLVIATGGLGQIYQQTTNPELSTGDGISLAIAKGITVEQLPYVQFHPTALYNPKSHNSFLISEAVRGHGAKLINAQGEQFMSKYDNRKELAPRDIVARAIYTEIQDGHSPCVFLDITSISNFEEQFPTIYHHLQTHEIDYQTKGIPVCPAAHYLCGGITTDLNGKTSKKQLYAIGETAYTGLHGSNRLASNSLLEGIVFAKNVCTDILATSIPSDLSKHIEVKPLKLPKPTVSERNVRAHIQRIVEDHLGVVKTTESIHQAIEKLHELKNANATSPTNPSIAYIENVNLLRVAITLAEQALEIRVNSGVFFNASHAAK